MKRIIKIILCFVLLFVFTSCGNKSINYEYKGDGQAEHYGQDDTNQVKNNVVYDTDRKIVYTVSYVVSGNKTNETKSAIASKVIDYAGYISSSNEENNYSKYVYHVPTNKLNDFLDFVDGQGGVSHKTINSEDITSQYNYTQARIDTLTASKNAYLNLLNDDTLSRSEIIQIQDKINDIDTELTTLNLNKAAYQNEVDYSTITITYYNYEYTYKEPSYFENYLDYLIELFKCIGSFLLYSFPIFVMMFGVFAAIYFPIRKKHKKNK